MSKNYVSKYMPVLLVRQKRDRKVCDCISSGYAESDQVDDTRFSQTKATILVDPRLLVDALESFVSRYHLADQIRVGIVYDPKRRVKALRLEDFFFMSLLAEIRDEDAPEEAGRP